MDTVAAQLAHIRSAESSCEVQPHIEVVVGIPHGSDAACDAAEVARVKIQMAVVGTQASVEGEAVECFADGGVGSDVEELVLRYQHLFAQVQ